MSTFKNNIPNTITCGNLISGCIATYFAFNHEVGYALTFIIIGAIFDFFDGFSARMLKVSSPLGKELDSLADNITFGFAPSAIIWSLLSTANYQMSWLEWGKYIIPFLAFLMAAFSALRLAKFNIDSRQTSSFIGLPTPANALFWGGIALEFQDEVAIYTWSVPIIIITTLLSCFLLTAEIPMFALKFKDFSFKKNAVRYFFLLTSLLMLIFLQWAGLSLVIIWYIFLSVITNRR